MANTGPIQVPSNVSQMKTLPDLVRFVAAFATEAASKFNGTLATKSVWGAIGVTGTIVTGSGNFGVSFVSTGEYWITFRQSQSDRPAPVLTPEQSAYVRTFGVTTTGFGVRARDDIGGNLQNTAFSFIAMGAR